MIQNTTEKALYQWVGGDKAGMIVAMDRIEYDSDDEIHYIYLENGDRVNAELEGELIVRIDSEEDAWEVKEEVIHDIREEKGQDGQIYEIPGPDHGKVKVIKVPKKRKTALAQVQGLQQPSFMSIPKSGAVNKPIVETDPVITLLEKAKKKKGTFDISLRVDVITQSLFEVISENYEDGEEKSLDYIVSLIDVTELKSQLKEKLKNVYKRNTQESTI
jgi:uncharacterized protein YuzE